MQTSLIPFGVRCRFHRNRLNYVMADQARELGCSVSAISAVERGDRPIPEGFPVRVANWLKLTDQQTQELIDLANGTRAVVHIFPKDQERAQLAFDFARA